VLAVKIKANVMNENPDKRSREIVKGHRYTVWRTRSTSLQYKTKTKKKIGMQGNRVFVANEESC